MQPLLVAKCVKCHGPEKQNGGLRLDDKLAAFKGGDSEVPAIMPGHASESRLVQLVISTDSKVRMPPEGACEPLTTAEVDLLRHWIDVGANWPMSPETCFTESLFEVPIALDRRIGPVNRKEDMHFTESRMGVDTCGFFTIHVGQSFQSLRSLQTLCSRPMDCRVFPDA